MGFRITQPESGHTSALHRLSSLYPCVGGTTLPVGRRAKEENVLEWVQRLNDIRACAREIVNEEIIFA